MLRSFKLENFFLSFFGVGFIPFAPGTFGTLATMPLIILITKFSIPFYGRAKKSLIHFVWGFSSTLVGAQLRGTFQLADADEVIDKNAFAVFRPYEYRVPRRHTV